MAMPTRVSVARDLEREILTAEDFLDRLGLLRDTAIDGAPDLVVEVLSPGTAGRDVGVKFVEYEQHGVDEYRVLDPEHLPKVKECLAAL